MQWRSSGERSWTGLAACVAVVAMVGCTEHQTTAGSEGLLPFKGQLTNDRPWSLLDATKRRPVLLVFLNDEPASRQAVPYAQLVQRATENRLQVMFVVPASNNDATVSKKGVQLVGPEIQAKVAKWGVKDPVLPDYGGVIGRNNRITTFPTFIVVGRRGNQDVRAEGLTRESLSQVLEGAGRVTRRATPQIDLDALPSSGSAGTLSR